MSTDDRWTLLKNAARRKLKCVDKPTFPESFLEYECEPSFQPIFNLQIIWSDKSLKWRFAKWDVHVDRSKFYETNGATKIVLLQPEPSIRINSGTAPSDLLKDVIAHIRQLQISPRIDTLRMFTLDGNINTLSLGLGDLWTTYRWHTLPEEWHGLQTLIDLLLNLHNSLEQE